MQIRTTNQVLAELKVGRRLLERLLEVRADLKPVATFAGAFAWTDAEVARVQRVLEDRKAARPATSAGVAA